MNAEGQPWLKKNVYFLTAVKHIKFNVMKKHAILIIMLLASLSSHAQIDKLTQSLNLYSLDLYRQLKTDNENLLFSPLSTYYALLIGYEGAQHKTKHEFESVLHIKDSKLLSDFPTFSKSLITMVDNSNTLTISNAIWIHNKLSVKADYKQTITQKYLSDLKTVDFKQKMVASNDVNNWVTDKTNGLIKSIISPDDIDDNTRMIISNAIYFIGKWAGEFNKNVTKPAVFYSIDYSTSEIDFMNKTEYLSYYENNDFQFISKPYKGNDKSFCIILPKKQNGLVAIEKELTNSTLETILTSTNNTYVRLSIPKFKLETNYSLIEPFKALGLDKAFKPEADFSGITTQEPLMINKVTHKAYIEINEKQTEAAAATAFSGRIEDLVFVGVPEPKVFKADHPFVFLIVDNKTKSILFMGRYVRPE